MNYSDSFIEKLQMDLKKAIKDLIKLRIPDVFGYIGSNGNDLYNLVTEECQSVINRFEPFYDYAMSSNDYFLRLDANEMAKEYNLMLDLGEPNAYVSDILIEKYREY